MPVDIALTKHLLNLLSELDGRPLSEDVLASELEIRTGKMLTTAQVRAVLIACRDAGWVDKRVDSYTHSDQWFITDAGRAKQQNFVG